MNIEQMYTNCLAEAAYFIESDGEAAIIDPIRETDPYIQKAAARGVKIKYVFETHFHADFVSGHLDLANHTGGTIVFGPGAETSYKTYVAKDNEVFKIGKITITALHTPGHTPESTSYLLKDENGKEYCIFTGDTLFVGDVGRPDLLDGKMTKEELASMMYDSLENKIKPLADDVIVYPAHGPGSACGKNIGKETWSTIGEQKKTNYALQPMNREEFIKKVTEGLSAPPAYFFKDAMINKQGYESIEKVKQQNLNPLGPQEFEEMVKRGSMVLDTRTPDDFEKGFIPGAINIGLNGSFATWVGTLVDIAQPLVIVAPAGKEEETIVRLARVGFEKVKGFLKGGMQKWIEDGKPFDKVDSITPEEFAKKLDRDGNMVLDVRKTGELENGFVKGAINMSLSEIEEKANNLDPDGNYLVHCAGGYRSMIATSILKKKGFSNIINVYGGFGKIKDTGVPIEKGIPHEI